ncbi:MAG TPA: hypothetical protein VF796_06600, partial [Humisphaera sp.]
MMSSDRFKLLRVRSYLVGAPGTREMTRFLLAAADRLSDRRREAIDRYAADLTADLARGRLSTPSVTARYRIEAFPGQPPPAALVRLACLYPGISKAWFKDRSAAADPLSALRNGFAPDQRTDAAEWLAWAVDQVEGLRLLPPPLRRKLLGDGTRAAGGDEHDAVADLVALTA